MAYRRPARHRNDARALPLHDPSRTHRARRLDQPACRLAAVSRHLGHRAGDEVRLDRVARTACRRSTCSPTIGCSPPPRSARWPNSSPTRSPGSIARGTRSTASSGRWAARLLSLAIVDSGDPAWQVASFLLGGGAALRCPCRQGGRAHAGQRQPRTVQQYRRLDRRGCRHRRAARAGHRQPDRRRAGRRCSSSSCRCGWWSPRAARSRVGDRRLTPAATKDVTRRFAAREAAPIRAGRSPPASSPPACRSSRAACSTSRCPRSAPATAPAPPRCNGWSTPTSSRCRRLAPARRRARRSLRAAAAAASSAPACSPPPLVCALAPSLDMSCSPPAPPGGRRGACCCPTASPCSTPLSKARSAAARSASGPRPGAASAAIAPLIGGWLVDHVGWPAIFYINLPLAAGAILLALEVRQRKPGQAAPRAPIIPAPLLATLGLGGTTYGLTRWSSTGQPRRRRHRHHRRRPRHAGRLPVGRGAARRRRR